MDNILIGKRLISLRETKGFTQQEVADGIESSVSAIGMYERGERIPRDEIKIKLAKFFDVSIESIFFDHE